MNDYPLLEVFWTMLILFGLCLWIWLLVSVFGDLFRPHDTGAGKKTFWVVPSPAAPGASPATHTLEAS